MQITRIAAFLSLVLPAVLAAEQASGALERRSVGGLASAATLRVREADAPVLAERSPKKKNGKKGANAANAANADNAKSKSSEPIIKASPGQTQAEEDAITAELDRENNPQKRSTAPKAAMKN
ncbi:hypothetical protein PgNI_10871 [Pyricularia grisea]|uniref:Uncharacterized protein n=1 Tax=Pyricularia grisea TaxID=148305 RepID=A0A6P8AYW5_PYRGI|nr:hypothetical protein PgNI_10871 [Pyricularia grisea]TLD07489.1 hypothetical protein PgNI_10871 [Pyricularia grisea]